MSKPISQPPFIVSDMTATDIPHRIDPELSPQGRSFRPSATSPGGRPYPKTVGSGGENIRGREYTMTPVVASGQAGRVLGRSRFRRPNLHMCS